jgi:hypothetical protein
LNIESATLVGLGLVADFLMFRLMDYRLIFRLKISRINRETSAALVYAAHTNFHGPSDIGARLLEALSKPLVVCLKKESVMAAG